MNRILFTLAAISFHLLMVGQQAEKQKSRVDFSLQFGVYYKTFISAKTANPREFNNGYKYLDNQYERFNKIPTVGLSAGLKISYVFSPHWGISGGIQYVNRKDVFDCNIDTIIKDGFETSYRDIRNVYKYLYSFHNLEIPLLIEYRLKRVLIMGGCNLSVLSYSKSQYSYVLKQPIYSSNWTTDEKEIHDFVFPFKFYPTVQLGYEIPFNRFTIYPWIALYYACKNQYDIYFQFGIQLPFYSTTK